MGVVTFDGALRTLGSGFLLPFTSEGYQQIQYVSLTPELQIVEAGINKKLNRLRQGGHLILNGTDSEGKQLLFSRYSILQPVERILLKAEMREKHLTLSQEDVLSHGEAYFQNTRMQVDRKYQKTRNVPYTIFRRKDNAGPLAGKAIISLYGGYGLLLEENYSPDFGRHWVENGGVFVFAHIRGSGGFGKKWYQAGTGTKKIEALLDLEALAEEIIATGHAKAGKISLYSNSAGGIVAGAAALRRPDLFDRISLISPCLILWDNQRGYCTLNDEFGDPTDPVQMKIMQTYSPGHLLISSKNVIPFQIVQSTNDQIVPPVVTETFIGLRPDLNFVDHILTNSNSHYTLYDYGAERSAEIAFRRLEFFLGRRDPIQERSQ